MAFSLLKVVAAGSKASARVSLGATNVAIRSISQTEPDLSQALAQDRGSVEQIAACSLPYRVAQHAPDDAAARDLRRYFWRVQILTTMA